MKLNTQILKTWRAQKGLSLEEAGHLVGVTGQAWFTWETGEAFPTRHDHLETLSELTGVAQGLLLIENEE